MIDTSILFVFGGIGLFLLGMLVLTDGLRGLAGNALRRVLARFTRSPASGAAAGAVTTAVVQSSSATTIATVGFVSAGLLTFPQALGIIFGANIGTTITGWLVAIVGFKLDLGTLVLPIVLIGVLLKLFGGVRLGHIGWTLAGFGVLFIGIDAMQEGMKPFEGTVTPDSFPRDTLLGRLLLVLIGVLITLVTQSSSAGVAAALVALASGTISFPQAAAMVIGMDIGTTFTAALATVGGSTATRQTGYAHVIYNLFTGTVAFFLLGPFSAAVSPWLADGGAGNAQIALVAFHTSFNTVGVLVALPFAGTFARFMVWLVPERGPPLLRRLDQRLLRDPGASVDAAAATVRETSFTLFRDLTDLLDVPSGRSVDTTQLRTAGEALQATRSFLDEIRTEPSQLHEHRRHVATMHALDHASRLLHRCEQRTRIETLGSEARLRRLANVLRHVIPTSADVDLADSERKLDRTRRMLRRQRRSYRARMVTAAALQEIGGEPTLQRLDAMRWLHRVAYHVWRIVYHLRRSEVGAAPESDASEPALEDEED